ncbi:hypothetical protein [Paenibacillus lautus]|uniref:hypothetical protein n=1 Tax=Paenibacillus lautus TaxID=1401 RepID=UPI003D2BAA1E
MYSEQVRRVRDKLKQAAEAASRSGAVEKEREVKDTMVTEGDNERQSKASAPLLTLLGLWLDNASTKGQVEHGSTRRVDGLVVDRWGLVCKLLNGCLQVVCKLIPYET